jgi:hypothetical protein
MMCCSKPEAEEGHSPALLKVALAAAEHAFRHETENSARLLAEKVALQGELAALQEEKAASAARGLEHSGNADHLECLDCTQRDLEAARAEAQVACERSKALELRNRELEAALRDLKLGNGWEEPRPISDTSESDDSACVTRGSGTSAHDGPVAICPKADAAKSHLDVKEAELAIGRAAQGRGASGSLTDMAGKPLAQGSLTSVAPLAESRASFGSTNSRNGSGSGGVVLPQKRGRSDPDSSLEYAQGGPVDTDEPAKQRRDSKGSVQLASNGDAQRGDDVEVPEHLGPGSARVGRPVYALGSTGDQPRGKHVVADVSASSDQDLRDSGRDKGYGAIDAFAPAASAVSGVLERTRVDRDGPRAVAELLSTASPSQGVRDGQPAAVVTEAQSGDGAELRKLREENAAMQAMAAESQACCERALERAQLLEAELLDTNARVKAQIESVLEAYGSLGGDGSLKQEVCCPTTPVQTAWALAGQWSRWNRMFWPCSVN